MTQQQDADIRVFIENRLKDINTSHRKQRVWLIGMIAMLIAGFIAIGYTEVIQRVSNTGRIEKVEEKVQNTLPYNVLIDVHKTYELEFLALASFIDGDAKRLEQIMQEFRSYRWSLLSEYENHDLRTGRGGNFHPWFLPGFMPFTDKMTENKK